MSQSFGFHLGVNPPMAGPLGAEARSLADELMARMSHYVAGRAQPASADRRGAWPTSMLNAAREVAHPSCSTYRQAEGE
jgi:hypothetical protein